MQEDPTTYCNRVDYRERITTATLLDGSERARAALTVCNFVPTHDLIEVEHGNPSRGYRLKHYELNIFNLGLKRAAYRDKVFDMKDVTPLEGYKFFMDDCNGNGSGYYVGNGLVATAGHVIYGDRRNLREKTAGEWCCLFGLAAEHMDFGDAQAIFPANRVFRIERILHGQYHESNIDRDKFDWALLSVRQTPGIELWEPPLFPLHVPLASYADLAGSRDIFTIGHPWGASAKIADTARLPGGGVLLTTSPTGEYNHQSQLRNVILHNILMNRGNSGGPIFLRGPGGVVQIIGTQSANGIVGVGNMGEMGFTKTWRLITPPETAAGGAENFNIATNTSPWYYLGSADSNVNVTYKLAPIDPTGYLYVYARVLHFTGLGSTISSCLVTVETIQVGYVSQLKKVTRRFTDLVAPLGDANIRPAHIIGLQVEYNSVAGSPRNIMSIPCGGQLDTIQLTVSPPAQAPASNANTTAVLLREEAKDIGPNPFHCPTRVDRAMQDAATMAEKAAIAVAPALQAN